MQTTDQLDRVDFEALKEALRGSLILPQDEGYDEARATWNGVFDRRPAAIARCTGTADVIAAIDFARENGLRVSVKSTGHSYAGHSVCDGGLVIDLSAMDGVSIDPVARTARVQPGVTWGAFDHEAQAFGLATTGATVSTVGVTGYTLGGGTGYLSRKHGLSLDNVVSLDVVTAAGDLLRASSNENADLFWGLRGGSGNFGVVTSLEFKLHEVGPEVLAGQIVFPFDQARDVLRFWWNFMQEAPDELQCYPFIIHVPPIPAFPESYHGKTAIDLVVAYAGPVSDGERALAPLRSFGQPILDGVFPQTYTALQQTFDAGMPRGLRWYTRAHYLQDVSEDAIDTVLHFTESLPGAYTAVYFEPEGGEIARIDSATTAFPHRDAACALHIFPGWTSSEDDAELRKWAQQFHDAMAVHATGGVYVNLLAEDEGSRISEAYGDSLDRLAKLKAKYDPDNFFRHNHNIPVAHT